MSGTTKYEEVRDCIDGLKSSAGTEKCLGVLAQLSKLKDEEYVPILAQILKENNSESYRKACYDLLSSIYQNTENRQCRELLWAGLLHETDAALLVSTLNSLDSIPNTEIFQRVCELVNHSKIRVRMSAIFALKFSENAEAELFLLNRLNVCRNLDELSHITIVMGEFGTSLALSALISTLEARSGNVWKHSIWAIGRISKRCGYNPTELFTKNLRQTKSYAKKAKVLNSLCFAGDESAVEIVKETLAEIISREKQKHQICDWLNLGGITDYLFRFAGREAAESFLKTIVEKYGNLQEHIPESQLAIFREQMLVPE